MLRGQLDPEVLKLIPLRSVSLKMRMSPVPLSRRQTLDPDRTLASGKLSGSRCVLAAFHAHFTLEKSTVRVSGFAAPPLPAVDINSNSNSASVIPVVILIVILPFNLDAEILCRHLGLLSWGARYHSMIHSAPFHKAGRRAVRVARPWGDQCTAPAYHPPESALSYIIPFQIPVLRRLPQPLHARRFCQNSEREQGSIV